MFRHRIYLISLLFLASLLFTAPLLALEVPESAYAKGAFDDGEHRVEAFLVTDFDVITPGQTVRAGVVFRMSPEWHIYWKSAGEGGLATEVIFKASHAKPGKLNWPTPTVYEDGAGEIITFGYDTETMIFADLDVEEFIVQAAMTVEAEIDYLVCKVDCIPGQATLKRVIPIGKEAQPASQAVLSFFEHYAARLPVSAAEKQVEIDHKVDPLPINTGETFKIALDVVTCSTEENAGNCIQLAAPPLAAVHTFAHEEIKHLQLKVTDATPHKTAYSGWTIELSGRASPDVKPQTQSALKGVLRLQTKEGVLVPVEVELPLQFHTDDASSPVSSTPAPEPNSTPLWMVLLFAFLGGMILNLMPCVFPVLAIKVFALTQLAHESRSHIATHGAAYTAGISSAMLALAGAVILLKIFGTQVGWGFQFQDPRYVVAVSVILVLFALNLFDVFQVGLGATSLQQKVDVAQPGMRRSFGEGILAVILATPCSAPLLGTAVGFALASSPAVIMLVFFVLGLGLAAPFVGLSLLPGLRKVLPKPGNWMKVLKQLLGFALLGTTIWLLWLTGQFAGSAGVVSLLIFLLVTSVAAWVFGLVQYQRLDVKIPALVLALAAVIATGWLTLPAMMVASQQAAESNSEFTATSWAPYAESAVHEELAQGRAVFVNFTADWCITCKVNEARVLSQPDVQQAFASHDVALFKGDWTRRDDVIRETLARFGKGGVPLYLLYDPADPQNPVVLPELLTRKIVIDALNALGEK